MFCKPFLCKGSLHLWFRMTKGMIVCFSSLFPTLWWNHYFPFWVVMQLQTVFVVMYLSQWVIESWIFSSQLFCNCFLYIIYNFNCDKMSWKTFNFHSSQLLGSWWIIPPFICKLLVPQSINEKLSENNSLFLEYNQA